MKLIALDPISHGRITAKRGEHFEAGASEGKRLISLGRAKMARPAANKMRAPAENKASDFQVAGEGEPSSASPADQALPQTTVNEFVPGVRKRRRRAAEESS